MATADVKLKIDGIEVTAPENTMILKAAKDNGIIIPTLCEVDGLTPYGGCRLCLVEIAGSPKLFPACTTPVAPGMEITTNSDRLTEYRKMVVQLLLSERTHICSVCVANDHCELQAMANQLGVDHVMFERNWTRDQVDSTHDFLVIDRNRCILCTRCIRVCDQIEGVHTLDLKLRGRDTEVIMNLMKTGLTLALAHHAANAPRFALSEPYTLKKNPSLTLGVRILQASSCPGGTANDRSS